MKSFQFRSTRNCCCGGSATLLDLRCDRRPYGVDRAYSAMTDSSAAIPGEPKTRVRLRRYTAKCPELNGRVADLSGVIPTN